MVQNIVNFINEFWWISLLPLFVIFCGVHGYCEGLRRKYLRTLENSKDFEEDDK